MKETQVSEFQPQVGGVGLKLKCRMMLLYYSFDGRSVLEGPGGGKSSATFQSNYWWWG